MNDFFTLIFRRRRTACYNYSVRRDKYRRYMLEKKSVLCHFNRPPISEASIYWVALSTLSISADIGKIVKIDSQETRVLTVQHLLRKNGYDEFRFVEVLIPFDHPDLVWFRFTDSIEIVGGLPYEIIDAAISRSDTATRFAEELITTFIDDIIKSTSSEEAEKMKSEDSVEIPNEIIDAAISRSDVAAKFAEELISSFIHDIIQSRSEEAKKMKADRIEYTFKWSTILFETLLEEFGNEQILDTATKAWNCAKTEREEFLSEFTNNMAQIILLELLSDLATELLTDCLDAIAISGLVQNVISDIVDSMKISPKISTTTISHLVPQQMRILMTTDESKFEDDNSTVDSSVCLACYVDDKEEDSLNFVKHSRIITRSTRPVTLAGKETNDIQYSLIFSLFYRSIYRFGRLSSRSSMLQ